MLHGYLKARVFDFDFPMLHAFCCERIVKFS